jgi:hypothetical protein
VQGRLKFEEARAAAMPAFPFGWFFSDSNRIERERDKERDI